MKSEWKTAKLGDLVTVKGGKRLPKGINLINTPNEHPYIRVRDINGNKTLELNEGYEFVDDETQKGISRYIVHSGDIVLSIVGSIGLTGIVGESLDSANLTENCVKLTDFAGINREYLYYFLKSSYGRQEIMKGTVGAVQAKLPIKNIQDFSVMLPDMDTQRKLSKVLLALDNKISLNQKINDNLEQQARALFRKQFIDNPECQNWRSGTFSDVIERMIAGDWGKETPNGNNTEMVYCIRGADIPEVSKGNKGKMPTRYILPKNYKAKQLMAGDIVVEISGGSPTQSTGRVAAVSQSLLDRYDHGMVCTNFCKAMKPISEYSMVVYYYWKYLYDKGVFFSYENGTTGIKNLDITGFTETEPIVIPPLSEVKPFNDFCHTIFNIIFANGLENERLGQLRDTLLPKLMSGEIDVSNI